MEMSIASANVQVVQVGDAPMTRRLYDQIPRYLDLAYRAPWEGQGVLGRVALCPAGCRGAGEHHEHILAYDSHGGLVLHIALTALGGTEEYASNALAIPQVYIV